MKRIILTLMILVAVPLYVWDMYLLLGGMIKKRKAESASIVSTTNHSSLNVKMSSHFVEKGRSPFLATKDVPKPVVKPGNSVKQSTAASTTPVKPPPITINGIMWNDVNPLVIINFSDGSSTIAKKGQTVTGGILIKTIEKSQVEVEFEGKGFWLKK